MEGNSASNRDQPRRKAGSRKKLKPLKKVKTLPNGRPDVGKLPVTELMQMTLSKSASMPSTNTILVSHDRIKNHVEDFDNDESMYGTLSPGRGLSSNRSYGNISLDGSDYSSSSRLTQQELLNVIKIRAERKLEPPAFVTPIEQLPPMHLSWNNKLPPNHNKHRPQVNIIGCMHPVELILAQADQRSRHQQETLTAKKKICEDKVKQIDDAIQLKYTRAERYALAFERKQRQIEWLKIIKLSIYFSTVYTNVRRHVLAGAFFSHSVNAAYIIRQACKGFIRRHLLHKFKYKFMVLFRKREFHFRLGMRIRRKRQAIAKIKTFLTEFRNHHQMNVVVHKYLMGVRKVQRNIRDFIACKHAKIVSLSVLWTRLERNYVKHMVEKRKLQKRTTGKMKSSDEEFADMNRQTLIEMKNQAKLWDRIDNMMEDKLKILKATGVIVSESEEATVEKHLLPPKRRWQALNDMLTFLRKEFYQSQRAVRTRLLRLKSESSPALPVQNISSTRAARKKARRSMAPSLRRDPKDQGVN